MKLQRLHLEHFKNYQSLTADVTSELVCIVGLNGAGKTNLLDAIHYLVFTKSAFGNSDSMNIQKEAGYFLVKGQWAEDDKKTELLCYQEKGQKKVVQKNKTTYEKLSDHIGQTLAVMFTPYDTEIIRGASEVRRKWIDGCISQYDPGYLHNLLHFQRQLKQRNSLLKQYEGKLPVSAVSLLDTYDESILGLSKTISQARLQFLDEFRQYFKENLEAMVEDHEHCYIELKSQVLDEGFEENFKKAREKDLINQRTTMGCHRDDFVFKLESDPIKRFGSQGQQKSFLIALKLAQFDHLAKVTKRRPILLLDDVFDKLDEERIGRLLHLLTDQSSKKAEKGQVFITDARKERTLELIENIEGTQLIEIKEGNLATEDEG